MNRLLRSALARDKRAALEREIAEFFGSKQADRTERIAFQSAGLDSWAQKIDCQANIGAAWLVPEEGQGSPIRFRQRAACDHRIFQRVTTIEKDRAVYPPLGTVSAKSLAQIEQAVKLALELP